MAAQAILAEADNDPGLHGADTQGYQQILHDLITMGADFARVLHGQATSGAKQAVASPTQQPTNPQHCTHAHPAPAPEALITLTLAFDRIAHAVRRSILLARSLSAPIQPARDPSQHRAAARRRIIREVEDAIQRTTPAASNGPDAPETLQAELRDRLDAPDLDDDLTTRPPADIISEICRDLGLSAPPGGAHPWKRRTPQDIADLCAAAAAPTGTLQPAAHQPRIKPQALRPAAPQPTPQPAKPTAHPRPRSSPIPAGSDPPAAPASTLATIPPHPTRVQGRWPPPLQAEALSGLTQ